MNARTLALAVCAGPLCPSALLGQAAQAWHPAPVPTLVMLEDGKHVALDDPDGKRLWTFAADRGSFWRMSAYATACDGRTVFTATDESFYAIAIPDGRLRWSYRFEKDPWAELVVHRLLAGRVFLTTSQAEAPLLCFDAMTGRLLWRYPKRTESMLFGEMRVQGGLLLASVKTDAGGPGWNDEKRAIDLYTGVARKWPTELDAGPVEHDDSVGLAIAYAGEQDAPSKDGNTFIGTVEKHDRGYRLQRPRFFEFLPECSFARDHWFPKQLIGKRVRVFGKLMSVHETSPPILNIRALAINVLETRPTDKDRPELLLGHREASLFRDGKRLWSFRPGRSSFFRGTWRRSRAISDGKTVFVSTETDLHALSMTDGRCRWSVAIPAPDTTRIGLLRLWGNELIAELDDLKCKLVRFDIDTGRQIWSYSLADDYWFLDMTMGKDALLVLVAPLSGHRAQTLAIDTKTGVASPRPLIAWPVPRRLDARAPLAVRFDDSQAPRREGNDYIGVLVREKGHYALASPPLFRHDRVYSFFPDRHFDLDPFVGKRVRIRGNLLGGQELTDRFDRYHWVHVTPLAVRLEPQQ